MQLYGHLQAYKESENSHTFESRTSILTNKDERRLEDYYADAANKQVKSSNEIMEPGECASCEGRRRKE